MAIAYYLLRDDDHDSRKNIVEMAKDLELSTTLLVLILFTMMIKNTTHTTLRTDLLQKIYNNARKRKYVYNPIRKHHTYHLFG